MPKKKKLPRKTATKKRKPVAESAKVKVEQRTNDELRKLAEDMVDDKIFYDGQLSQEAEFLLPQIFAPLGPSIRKELLDFNLIGMLYEYMDKNIKEEKESIPIFNTMNIVHIADMPILHELYQEMFSAKFGEGELHRLRQQEQDEIDKSLTETEPHVHGPDCNHE